MSVTKKMIVFAVLFAFIHVASPENVNEAPPPASSSGLFAADLLQQLVKDKSSENVIFSPISVQTALAMTYLGAAGDTAKEMSKVLHLASDDVDQVGTSFAQILNQSSRYAQVIVANRIFVDSKYELKPEFNERSNKYFNSEAEKIDFKENLKAVATINSWIEERTNHKIKDLIQPKFIDGNTAFVLVNAIYFKGRWLYEFKVDSTRKSPFWHSQDDSVDIDTMFGLMYINYGKFPELDASGIELPYRDSNISMLLLLPNQRNGLANLESKLSSVSLADLGPRMRRRLPIRVGLPKFKVEFEASLTDVLKNMGMNSLFDDAELPGIFQSGPSVSITDVLHKAVIEVNEAGSEAYATSASRAAGRSMPTNFFVDHPFLFAIKSPEVVYFVGHVVKI